MSDADKAYQIAEDRIARAKLSGAKALSLSPRRTEDTEFDFDGDGTPELAALDQVPSRISDLTNLQELYLDTTKIEDISSLAAMTGIQTLNLSCTRVTDISVVFGMNGLETLTLHKTKVADIYPLAALTKIRSLALDGTGVVDISPLAALTGLQTLTLNKTNVADISHLTAMIDIRTLTLNDTLVEDVSPLTAMNRLNSLWLSDTPADLRQLVAKGAAWDERDRALRNFRFKNTPATKSGGCLNKIFEAYDNHFDRSKAALASLRADRDQRTA